MLESLNQTLENANIIEYKQLDDFSIIALLEQTGKHKWWRFKNHDFVIDFGFKMFSNIKKIIFVDNKLTEI